MEENLVLHTADGIEVKLPIAGVGSRSFAFIIDWHIRLFLGVAWFAVAMKILAETEIGNASEAMNAIFWFAALPALMLYALYHPILEILMRGRTPGKRWAGVRIVSTNGQTPGSGALLIRNLFRLVDSLPALYLIGLGVAMATARQVRIGDLAAGTVLVYEERAAKLDVQAEFRENSRIGPLDADWLQDLLDRWRALDKAKRRQLAKKFLERIEGSQLEPWLEQDDTALRERLAMIMRESRAPVPQ